jgi:PAS domain S-box-containing protein
MTRPELAADAEAARLDRLRSLRILDSTPEVMFDQATRLAADLCLAPIALISLIDADRQWFKSNIGLEGTAETARFVAFCSETCRSDALLEISDASQDPRFADNPMVSGEPGIRFYAGAPIIMPQGERVGALCVIDRAPRQLTAAQRAALAGLSRMVATALLEREQRIDLIDDLARAESTYRVIVEGQSDLVSLADEHGKLIYVNAAYAEFFGLRPEAMVGRSLFDFVAQGDRDAVFAHLRQVSERGEVAREANRMISARGAERWVAWTNRLVPAQDGRSKLIHSVGRDITEQRQAEAALAQNELRSRLLYESTPAMLHSIDPAGDLINVSDTWLRMLGYERREVLGRPSVEFLAPESQLRARAEVIPAFFAAGKCDEVHYQMVRKDGSVIDVLMSAVLERDSEGRPVRSLAVSQDVTERRATASLLRESRHLLQLVLDNLPARISYWDAASKNLFANRAFLNGFGVTQEAITGRHARDVLGADWYDRIQAPIERGLAGHPGRIEVSFAPTGAARRDIEMHFTPDQPGGQVRGLFVFALDVTARREAERGLAERERRFKQLIDGVRDYAIYMLDAQGRVSTWTAGAENIKGYRAAEVLGQHFRMFFTPEDIAAGTPEHELAVATIEGRFEVEGWRMRADGRKFWAGVWLSAIHGERGELIGYAKITRDLTEQVRQKLLLERAVELAPCAMLMVDAQGGIVMVNAQSERTFGYARADLVGQPLEKLIPARWRAQHPGQREGFLRYATVRTMGAGRELRALRSNGEEFPIEIGLSPIESDNGIATLAAVFDITERRRQQALIEKALAEKETLLKEVYHRVKNNLQVVQSLLSLQSQTLPEGAARDAIDDSAQRVRSMALVHEKLYQSGNLAAVSLRVYVKDLMDQIAEAHGTDRRKVKLHAEIADLQTGLDSAVPFGLLLTELITNCLKHAFKGRQGGEIRVSLERQVDGDLLTVSDDGVGLPAGFISASASTSMGLQLADGLAHQLGGELRAHNDGGAVLRARLSRL